MPKLEIRDYPYDNQYAIYSDGRIYSKKRKCFLTPRYDKKGYLRVTFRPNKIPTVKAVHRIIAETFLENPFNYPQVNHKDECKENNSVDNLEWCTAKYNSNYGTRLQRVGRTRKERHCKGKKVAQYNRNGELVAIYNSINEAGRSVNICATNISAMCRGKGNAHWLKDSKWAFYNEV